MLLVMSGALAGTLHVLSGPDHLAAVAPYAVGERRSGHGLGATWGLGHGGGALIWLALAWLLRGSAPGARISELAELFVGVSLLLVGGLALRRHTHGQPPRSRRRAAFGFGLLHGTAGANHLALALPTLGLEPLEAAAYVLGYFGSAVLAMACVSGALSQLGTRARDALPLTRACGALALLVGAYWLVETGRAIAKL